MSSRIIVLKLMLRQSKTAIWGNAVFTYAQIVMQTQEDLLEQREQAPRGSASHHPLQKNVFQCGKGERGHPQGIQPWILPAFASPILLLLSNSPAKPAWASELKRQAHYPATVVWGLHLHEKPKKGEKHLRREKLSCMKRDSLPALHRHFASCFPVLVGKMKPQKLRGDSKGTQGYSASFKCNYF